MIKLKEIHQHCSPNSQFRSSTRTTTITTTTQNNNHLLDTPDNSPPLYTTENSAIDDTLLIHSPSNTPPYHLIPSHLHNRPIPESPYNKNNNITKPIQPYTYAPEIFPDTDYLSEDFPFWPLLTSPQPLDAETIQQLQPGENPPSIASPEENPTTLDIQTFNHTNNIDNITIQRSYVNSNINIQIPHQILPLLDMIPNPNYNIHQHEPRYNNPFITHHNHELINHVITPYAPSFPYYFSFIHYTRFDYINNNTNSNNSPFITYFSTILWIRPK